MFGKITVFLLTHDAREHKYLNIYALLSEVSVTDHYMCYLLTREEPDQGLTLRVIARVTASKHRPAFQGVSMDVQSRSLTNDISGLLVIAIG